MNNFWALLLERGYFIRQPNETFDFGCLSIREKTFPKLFALSVNFSRSHKEREAMTFLKDDSAHFIDAILWAKVPVDGTAWLNRFGWNVFCHAMTMTEIEQFRLIDWASVDAQLLLLSNSCRLANQWAAQNLARRWKEPLNGFISVPIPCYYYAQSE